MDPERHEREGVERTADEGQLQAQGHETDLPRAFSFFSTLALAFSITNTWIGYSETFVTPLLAGSGKAVFWCLVLACIACTIIAAGLAELASAFPSSGGQYHYAFMVAPKAYRAPIAFVTGWLSCLGWLFTTASTGVFCSQASVSLAALYHPAYVWTQWQVWCIYALIMIIACAIICLLPAWIPRAEQCFLGISILGFLVSLITDLVASPTKQPAKVVFSDWNNTTGWPDGLAFLVATGQAMYGFLGLDAATHIAEELPDPGRDVPRVLMLIMIMGSATTIPWAIAFMFSTNDLGSVASSFLPIWEVYHQATKSQSAATFFAVWIVFIYFGALVSCFLTSGRLLWAFSRDGGLPYSKTFAFIHSSLRAPVNATLLASIFIVLLGLLNIASTTAFNSIVSLAILASNATSTIPQTMVLLRGRSVLPPRSFNLGTIVGPFANGFSTVYVALYIVVFCIPVYRDVTSSSMNYVSAVLVGILILVAILWFSGKSRTFSGPQVDFVHGIDPVAGQGPLDNVLVCEASKETAVLKTE
ncbi:hypothetical protein AUEXF2481DRAFT_74039 [Aureobasidium subglaciale EXF-2481]|uniref:Amino acid permease/ SLC12A domain-containing protein n=1 Tax=Aureobasidium subglaciale (strain EXF-2481) TaxID=1043005 RepID=A0A074Y5F3_AURSE|nr:uncharacterized protein AUEXF2481DRAFT_74039 [Aureobasidium subglaciale EXF-2481]KEQ93028.1 hypothetical protein AUEXF2481DRAFT_74039 [Aureobasidium subglaciale EXF-2481]